MRLTPITTSTQRWISALIGLGFLALGALLLTRPLTTLMVIVLFTACALAAVAFFWGWRGKGAARWIGVGILGLLAVAIVVMPTAALRLLPALMILLLGVGAVLSVIGAVRRGSLGSRLIDAALALSAVLAAMLVWIWPDAAVVLLAFAFAVFLIVAGIALVVVGLRKGTGRRQTTARGRGKAVGAVLGVAVTVAATFGSIQLNSGIVSVDDFYTWEEAIPADPGQVLRVAPYEGEVPSGASAVRVLYATTYADGSPALASAVVAYPKAQTADRRDVLAWQHGTTGVAQPCGPSVGSGALTEYAIPGISRALERGWVVVATDYPGQGTPGRYPYLIGEGEGRATLDGIRAAAHLDDAQASDRAWIWGHSQGGHATLWAGQIADDYAPDIDVIGVAALSAATDPLALAQKITGAGESALGDVVTSFVVVPYADEYADVNVDDTVHPAGQILVEAFATRCAAESPMLISAVVAAALAGDSPLYRLDLAEGATHARLSENIASGIVPVPLFLGQGTADEVIPIAIQRELDAELCAADRVVETHEYANATHMGVIAEGSPLIDDLYAWADAVMDGEQPVNCG